MASTFDMVFTEVYGGPCPVCGHSGELLRQFGKVGGLRNIHHLDDQGSLHKCVLYTSDGILCCNDGSWWYREALIWMASNPPRGI